MLLDCSGCPSAPTESWHPCAGGLERGDRSHCACRMHLANTCKLLRIQLLLQRLACLADLLLSRGRRSHRICCKHLPQLSTAQDAQHCSPWKSDLTAHKKCNNHVNHDQEVQQVKASIGFGGWRQCDGLPDGCAMLSPCTDGHRGLTSCVANIRSVRHDPDTSP